MTPSHPFKPRLKLPIIAAPMFLASGPELVIECCKAGILGTFPALNHRTSEGFEDWVVTIKAALATFEQQTGETAAPFGVNLIVHHSNQRLEQDLAICVKHKVPLIITSLGAVSTVVDAVHSYGGQVFHDVVNSRHAKKAASVGVDGIIAVAAGAGGHAGHWSPFALINEIRQFFDKAIVLSGCISTGRDVATAQMMGADFAYMGSRLLATTESQVQSEYKQMLVDSGAADIVYTPAISGVPASFLRPSIKAAGLDLASVDVPQHLDFGAELAEARDDDEKVSGAAKAWKDIWSAGQGVGSIADVVSTHTLISRLREEYDEAHVQQMECHKY